MNRILNNIITPTIFLKKTNSINNKGFSLIELSIVLIILGLLIVGVTGGASLIKSAKINSVINEINQYSTAFNTYYGIHYKVPGASSDNKNCIGECNWLSALSSSAWQDLKDEGLVDKEIGSVSGWNKKLKYINSKYPNAGYFWFVENEKKNNYKDAFLNKNTLFMRSNTQNNYGVPEVIKYEDALSIDKKMDDGNYQSGKVLINEPSTENNTSILILQDIQ